MENSIYNTKLICTYDLKDENGIYDEELVLEWKEAAANRLLRCAECGAPVYLAAGSIKEPYFAHYDIAECEYGSGQESEELKKGKRLLYRLLKRSFPDDNIQARYRLENGMYSTLFCSDGEQSMAVDYRLSNNSLQQFRLRDDYYQAHKIKVIYVLGARQEKATKQLDWYQNLLQNSMGYLVYLDTKKEQLTLKRSFGYRLGKVRHFKNCVKAYPIRELTMDYMGRMLCDFSRLCEQAKYQIEEEKLKHRRIQDELHRLQEEKQRLEREEVLRMEAYRRQQMSEHNTTSILLNEPPLERWKHTDEEIMAMGLNVAIYHKCVSLIEQGEGHLVAKKYYDLIMGLR